MRNSAMNIPVYIDQPYQSLDNSPLFYTNQVVFDQLRIKVTHAMEVAQVELAHGMEIAHVNEVHDKVTITRHILRVKLPAGGGTQINPEIVFL